MAGQPARQQLLARESVFEAWLDHTLGCGVMHMMTMPGAGTNTTGQQRVLCITSLDCTNACMCCMCCISCELQLARSPYHTSSNLESHACDTLRASRLGPDGLGPMACWSAAGALVSAAAKGRHECCKGSQTRPSLDEHAACSSTTFGTADITHQLCVPCGRIAQVGLSGRSKFNPANQRQAQLMSCNSILIELIKS